MFRVLIGVLALAVFGSMAYGAYLVFSGGAAPALPGFIPASWAEAVGAVVLGDVEALMWRDALWAAAAGLGALGGLLLIFKARLSAVLLWLSFLLAAGVFLGVDMYMGDGAIGYQTPVDQLRIGIVGAAFLFAVIAQFSTGDDGYAPPVAAAAAAAPRPAPAAEAPPPARPEPAPAPEPVAEPTPEPAPEPVRDEPMPEPAPQEEPRHDGEGPGPAPSDDDDRDRQG